ncbi:YhgE/Pip family protein [Limosilactobacillus equigenerosi]|uniref:YhgE/Pip family protein n=1 Tax=Limosilactobacillus equigenerosi TaxID=417373 RepID=UPI000A74D8DE|nr:YhgE/Pip domain-containing protein [Limosilactobacillus equigenerosi]
MLGMIKAEFRHIRHNRLLLLSTVVICFIPFLYSIFFLKSVWDPYGTTQNLPVAVVNHDQPVKYQGKRFAVGQQMTDELKKNHQLKWEIVSQKQANYGLKHREYYTVVTIPKDFSKDATTVLDHQPTKMKLTYTTNDSLNMIAEVISRMGMSQLNQQIRGQVTKAYAKTMFSMVKKVKGGMVEAANGAGQLDQGMATLSDGLNQYVAGVSQVNNGVQTLRASVMPLGPAAAKLAAGSSQLATGAQTYTAGVGQAAAGAGQLHQGIGQYTAGVQQLGNGLQQINGQSAKLKAGANQLATGSDQLSQGTKELNDRVTTANGQLKGQLAGLNTSLAQAQALQQQLPAVANGMQQMQAGMVNVKSALAAVNQAASALQSAPSGGSNTAATDQQIAGQLSALAGSTTDDKIKGQLSALAPKLVRMRKMQVANRIMRRPFKTCKPKSPT